MTFENRTQAGKLLAGRLKSYQGQDVVVLGIPRGGVVVAKEVAQALGAPLDVFISKKIGAPGNPEYAIGVVSETGQVKLNEEEVLRLGYSSEIIDQVVAEAQKKVADYSQKFRAGKKLLPLLGKIVIIVDDGIATGFTVKAVVEAVRAKNPLKVVVAVPVAPEGVASELSDLADEFVVLDTPQLFFAIGQFYQDFEQVGEEEVRRLLGEQRKLT